MQDAGPNILYWAIVSCMFHTCRFKSRFLAFDEQVLPQRLPGRRFYSRPKTGHFIIDLLFFVVLRADFNLYVCVCVFNEPYVVQWLPISIQFHAVHLQ